ncbi:hypothetical protein D0Z00_001017 [Geotrichum galactomycetum]|uniref:Uncharacterized protein n=1 Tax=Geotrichum galactomycetum TaxID=27317 RepID=A0ACB6V805_9ASCO|nr:hypothetical protein D0Z00_001017 [Geotrichum candidum]
MTATTHYATAVGAQHAGATYTDSESDGDGEGLIYQAYESDPRDGYLYPFLNNFPTSRRGSSGDNDYDDGSETTILSLRGEAIEITKRELAQLPDSIIIGLSNSIVMPENDEADYQAQEYYETRAGTGAGATAAAAASTPDFGANPLMVVDYSPACLRYILKFYREAAAAAASSSSLLRSLPAPAIAFDQKVSPSLLPPPSVFILREEIEYYCIPTRPNLPPETLNYIKHECGLLLLQTDGVFSGFRDCDDDKEAMATVSAAAVLEDARVRAVLMRNGVGANTVWGVREMEPGRTMISSLLLVRLEEENGDDNGSGYRNEGNPGVIAGSASSLNLAATGAAAETVTTEAAVVAPADQPVANDSKSSVTISNVSNSISGGSTSRFDTKAQETATLLADDDEIPTKDTQKDDDSDNDDKNNNDSMSHTSHLSNNGDHDRHDHIRDSNYADAEEEDEEEYDDDVESVAFLPLVAATDLTEFRRKPARRCWWSKFTVEDVDGYGDVTLHVRKVWVLEVCSI